MIGASICRGTGATEPWPNPDQEATQGQVEFLYAYAPERIPGGPLTGGMWRYRELLPIADGEILYPMPIGGTPLLAPPALRRETGLAHLYLKDETRGPTGSNKDRATALVLERALRSGIKTVSCASTGNVATSLAVGAAAAGLQAVVFVPEEVNPAKLRLMLLAGARVLKVREGYAAAFRISREAAKAFGWLDRNTGVNPATLEAKKTVAFEIWEQLGRRMPDVVVAPIGDGPTLSALAKGFRELVLCGVASRVPRIIGVQAEGCQPVKRILDEDSPLEPIVPDTLADGIAVGAPVSASMVVREVRESGGSVLALPDEAFLEAIGVLAQRAGVLAEPAGAAAFAGLLRATSLGLVAREETVVALVTGTGLKTPDFLRPVLGAHTIGADLSEVEQALR